MDIRLQGPVQSLHHDLYSKAKAHQDHGIEVVRYRPKVHAGRGTEFYVYANRGMTLKWRSDPEKVPILDVLQAFEVYHGSPHGEHTRPSSSELENHFGTSDTEEVVRQILLNGMVH